MAAEHVVAAGSYTSDAHSKTEPDFKGFIEFRPYISIRLERQRNNSNLLAGCFSAVCRVLLWACILGAIPVHSVR